MSDSTVDLSEFEGVPRWACVAFGCRCARRVLPLLNQPGFEGHEAVRKILDFLDSAIAAAREYDSSQVFELIDEADDIDLKYRGRPEEGYRVLCHAIAAAKFASFGVIEFTDDAAKHASDAYRNSRSAACFSAQDDPDEAIANYEVTSQEMRRDFERLKQLSMDRQFGDDSPIPIDLFGAMWLGLTPSWTGGQGR